MKLADYSAYIFDMDGTLIHSAPQIMACLCQAFVRVGYEVPSDLFSVEKVGPPIRQIISSIAPELEGTQTQEEIVANFREIYDYSTTDDSRLYPHMETFLQTLHRLGKPLFVATFKPKVPTLRLINRLGLTYFKDVYTVDKYAQPISKTQMITEIVQKYALLPKQVIMFGDTESDLTAAKQAGTLAAACLWGYGQNKENLKNISDFSFASAEELLP